jgi:hypothetical protein
MYDNYSGPPIISLGPAQITAHGRAIGGGKLDIRGNKRRIIGSYLSCWGRGGEQQINKIRGRSQAPRQHNSPSDKFPPGDSAVFTCLNQLI